MLPTRIRKEGEEEEEKQRRRDATSSCGDGLKSGQSTSTVSVTVIDSLRGSGRRMLMNDNSWRRLITAPAEIVAILPIMLIVGGADYAQFALVHVDPLLFPDIVFLPLLVFL